MSGRGAAPGPQRSREGGPEGDLGLAEPILREWLRDAPDPSPDTRLAIRARVASTAQRPRLAVVGMPRGLATSFRLAVAAAAAIVGLAVIPPLLWPTPPGPAATSVPTALAGRLGTYATASAPIEGGALTVGVGPASAWVATRDRHLVELDRSTLAIRATYVLPDAACGAPAQAGDQVWVPACGGTLLRLDTRTGKVERYPGAGLRLGVDGSRLWALDALESSLLALDPATGDVERTIRLEGQSDGVLVGLGAVWVIRGGDGRVVRVDPESGDMTSVEAGDRTYAAALGTDRLWIADFSTGRLTAVSPAGVTAGTIDGIGSGPAAMATTTDRLWILVDDGLAIVDTSGPALLETIPMAAPPAWIAGGDDDLWLVAGDGASVIRVNAGR